MIEIEVTPRRPKVKTDISAPGETINVKVGPPHAGNDYPRYIGPKIVTPEANNLQILQTKKKLLLDNVAVLPIPYYETSNPKGGTTVYIGD